MQTEPFASLPQTAQSHFELWYYTAVLQVIAQGSVSLGTEKALLAKFPFLSGYAAEMALIESSSGSSEDAATKAARWSDALPAWEANVTGHLPIRALRQACGLSTSSLRLLFCVGLGEEDIRFGRLFSEMQGIPAQHRPTVGLLAGWAAEGAGREVRADLRRLIDLGLVRVVNSDGPRAEWGLEPAPLIWDALRGETHVHPAAWARFRPAAEGLQPADLLLPAELGQQLAVAARMLLEGEIRALILRGPQHNGRRTLAGAIARALGKGVLQIDANPRAEHPHRWQLAGPLAAALGAIPVIVCELSQGELFELPKLTEHPYPCIVILGRYGGVGGDDVDNAPTFYVPVPTPPLRRMLWLRGLGDDALGKASQDQATEAAFRWRMTSGNVIRCARLTRSQAKLRGADAISLQDVRLAARSVNAPALDMLATRVQPGGDWSAISVSEQTTRELEHLRARCLHRERLNERVGDTLGGQLNPGVRALFSGPSGTGKTLAARLLAGEIQKDLFRLDLSSVVSKYIGETEKHLDRILAAAEELDVMLLVDEGDSILANRTDVNNANDRHSNFQTGFLLQRLEAFEGIVIVTTNAADRIDPAFKRRMDVVVEFRMPDASERWNVWQSHLPEGHQVEDPFLSEVSVRCVMTGGQIRNAVLHAALLAMENGGVVKNATVDAAVRREYRKSGAVCPLRPLKEGG